MLSALPEEEAIMSKLKDEIRVAVCECGLSVKYMAKASGLNRSTVERYWKGHRGSYLDKLEKLLDVAGYRLKLVPTDPHQDKYRSDRRFAPSPLD